MDIMEMLHNPTFWVAGAFFVFIALSYKKIGAMLITALDERSARIKQELDQASALRREAEQVLAEYKRKQAEHLKEAEAMLEKARQDAEAFNAEAQKELRAALESRTQSALERISREEEKAVQDVRNHIVDIALASARAVIKEQAGSAAQDDLVRLAIADIDHKVH